MADPKKPAADDPIPPEQMTYPTPELNEAGAPLDTRFQSDNTQEATASQPSPKSEEKPAQAKAKTDSDEDDEDAEDNKKVKGKEPRSRR